MNEVIERAVAAILTTRDRYSSGSRDTGDGEEWFIADDELPGGEFAAGPFKTEAELDRAMALLLIKIVVTAIREPDRFMFAAGIAAQWDYSETSVRTAGIWEAMVDTLLKAV